MLLGIEACDFSSVTTAVCKAAIDWVSRTNSFCVATFAMWRSSIERCASSRWSTSSLERSTIRLFKESTRDSYPALIPASTGDSLPCCVGTELFCRPWTSSPVSPLETAGGDVSLGLVGVLRERLRVSILNGDDAPDEAREPRPRRASLISFD